ncbi:hypothetical protein NMG60_11031269 [Bertholletia excelsa]
MDISSLLTSAGINIGLCAVLLSLYSILRKQPSNASVYFGRRLAQSESERNSYFFIDRFVPSPSWIKKAWLASEEEILASGGLDAVSFLRIVVFSIRIFAIAAVICIFLVLPLNYHGRQMKHHQIPSESLDVFTIGNVKEGSNRLWAHCLALYVISCSACVLLYFEYKKITKLRLEHIVGTSGNPSQFTVLVRSIPCSPDDSYSDLLRNYFMTYHPSSYLSHQMVYRFGTVQKLKTEAAKICKMLKSSSTEQFCATKLITCGQWGDVPCSFDILSGKAASADGKDDSADSDLRSQEYPVALVFFRTRYAALVASQVLHSSNPMLWVTNLAPEPDDVYWKNLRIPYRQLWIRRIVTLLAAIVFMFLFIIPVTLVQGLLHLEDMEKRFPFLRGILKNKLISRLVTGYLPSVVLMLFLYAVPPTMMLFSTIEGAISRSGRKKSACCKVLYFLIWNVFFVNVLSGSAIERLNVVSSPKDVPTQLGAAVPTQATFFMTYVLTSGWASLSAELMQLYALLYNFFNKFIRRKKNGPCYIPTSFPYHTEIPRVLLLGFLGFTYSIMAPLILPFLLVYFMLAYLVYRNQILNTYITKYQSGGKFWPIMHNTTIFSLVMAQVIALGVFGLKKSTVAPAFTFLLIIFTLLFNEYCRQRFHPVFKEDPAEILIQMDRKDEQSGKLETIHQQLQSAYCQFASISNSYYDKVLSHQCNHVHGERNIDSEEAKHGNKSDPVNGSQPAHSSLEIEELKEAEIQRKQNQETSPQVKELESHSDSAT